MTNTFGCRHSLRLQIFFNIENRGVDYVNAHGVRFEFKESNARSLEQMFFKVPKIQLENTDFIIFCVYDVAFYIHRSKRILLKYQFDNKYSHCCLRYTTIRRNFFAKFDNYTDLRKYIDERVIK